MGIIHRFWDGPPNDLNDWSRHAVETLHPNDTLIQWNAHSCPVNIHQVKEEDVVRHISNVTRYAALYLYGGIWLDHDVVPLCNLFEHTINNSVTGLNEKREGCFMRFESGHPFLEEALRLIRTKPISNKAKSTDVSGARLLNEVSIPVSIDSRILPFDAVGTWTNQDQIIAVHMWETSRKRAFEIG